LKVDREMDELTMALENPEHTQDVGGAMGWCRGSMVSREI
jgi:hypothetical protein